MKVENDYKTGEHTRCKGQISNSSFQAIPGNDQNASPTNQKTAGRKPDRTS